MKAGWLRACAALTFGLACSACGPDAAPGAGGSGGGGAAADAAGAAGTPGAAGAGGPAAAPGKAPAAAAGSESGNAAGSAPGAAARAPRAPGELPNIIVYLVDTLRADGLGVYGNARDTSPGIDAFAQQAAVFETAIAQAPWTLPSVTSLFTSTFPYSHQVLSNYSLAGEQAETMVEFMHDLGYHTVGFITNTLGGKGAGLDQGYDEFFEQQSVHDLTPEQLAAGAHSLKPLFDWAMAYRGEQPVFLYVHTVEPHNPWSGGPQGRAPWVTATKEERARLNAILPEQRGLLARRTLGTLDEAGTARLAELTPEIEGRVQQARDLYDGDVRQANDNFQRLAGILSHRPRWESTVMVLVADHGEELYEHGSWYHGQSVCQELVHVPLLLRAPGYTEAGLRIAQPVQLIDVLPTLADLLGVAAAPQWQGRSLLPLLRAARDGHPSPAAPPVYTMRISVDTMKQGEPARERAPGDRGHVETAVIEDGWKLIAHHDIARASLYDLRSDPTEQHDLSEAEPARVKHLHGLVEQKLRELPRLDLRRADPGDAAEQDEKRQHLEELGYIDGQVPHTPQPAAPADPPGPPGPAAPAGATDPAPAPK
jgi:arylsulfatase A-like enzyme